MKFFSLILRFSRSAKYHRLIVKERDLNFSHFQRVVFKKCGSSLPQKDGFVIVFYTDINIQFKIGIYKQIGVIGLAKSKKKKSLLGNISCQSFSKEYHLIPTFCVVIHDLLRDLQKIVSWTAEKNI